MRLESARDVFAYRLGTAVTMERDNLETLGRWEKLATSSEVKDLFNHHAKETREQLSGLLRCFELGELELKEKPCPTTKGLGHEGTSLREKVDEELADLVLVGAAAAGENYEIASYSSLIPFAKSLGLTELIPVLDGILEQELHTFAELQKLFTTANIPLAGSR